MNPQEHSAPLKNTLEKVLFDLKNRADHPTNRVARAWPSLVGDEIQKHTKPYALREGKLFVWVDDPNWSFELTLRYKLGLIKKLQQEFGADTVRDIVFTSRRI